jgi:diguanylate cyclase (GGDEF)-like protein/PAS domain S-box-containing protein
MNAWEAVSRVAAVRVLLVEDNPGDARLVRLLLTEDAEQRYEVVHVASLAEAVGLVGKRSFDIVLTDLGLPDSTGTGTVDAMLQAWPDCPVVVLTGLSDHSTGTLAVKRGCQDYLVKGFDDPQLLQRTVRYAIERGVSARELKESEERFRTLVEVSPDAILLCTEGSVIFANMAAVTTLAATRRQDLLGYNPGKLFTCQCFQRLEQALASPNWSAPLAAERFECTLARLDGSQFDAEVTVAPVLYRGQPAAEVMLRDITERKLAEGQNRLAGAVFATTDEALLVTDAHNKIVAVNPAFERVTGYHAAEVLGHDPHMLSSGRHGDDFYHALWKELMTEGHWHGELWNRRKNGEVYVQRVTFSLVRDAEGKVVNHVGVFSDITDEKQEAERIRYRASYDALTGLPNRALLHDRLLQSLAKASRERGHLGLLFIDLDGFKPVNDHFGHLVGDHLLVAVAERMHGCVRESDTVARLGGDEFVIVLPDMVSASDAQLVAAKVVASLGVPFELDGVSAQIGTSIGIAIYPQNGQTAEELLRAADHAMYIAKESGKGCYVISPEEAMA